VFSEMIFLFFTPLLSSPCGAAAFPAAANIPGDEIVTL